MENNNNLPTSPDWSTAPGWANWFAIDADGDGHYFQFQPIIYFEKMWGMTSVFGCRAYVCQCNSNNWKNSLQKRPDNGK